MFSLLRRGRRPQKGPGDPFLEVEAGETPAAKAFLDRREAALLSRVPDPGAGKILVLGAGTGRLAVKAGLKWPACEVTCVDLSGPAQSEALDRARAAGLVGRFWYRCGDACKTDLPDHSFELVLCDGLLHHVPDPARLLNETARVARPGAFILFRDQERPLRGPLSWLPGGGRSKAPEPLRRAWAESCGAAYTLSELQEFAACSRLAEARVQRVRRSLILLVPRFQKLQ